MASKAGNETALASIRRIVAAKFGRGSARPAGKPAPRTTPAPARISDASGASRRADAADEAAANRERTRIAKIQYSPEAKHRAAAALALALDTDLTSKEARAVLATMPQDRLGGRPGPGSADLAARPAAVTVVLASEVYARRRRDAAACRQGIEPSPHGATAVKRPIATAAEIYAARRGD